MRTTCPGHLIHLENCQHFRSYVSVRKLTCLLVACLLIEYLHCVTSCNVDIQCLNKIINLLSFSCDERKHLKPENVP
jgi:hypothetical protein